MSCFKSGPNYMDQQLAGHVDSGAKPGIDRHQLRPGYNLIQTRVLNMFRISSY